MKDKIQIAITVIACLTLLVLGFVFGWSLSPLQKDTLVILLIICGASMAYCFIVGEITRNNSQMDKLWSVLPFAYVWVIAAKGGMNIRLIVMAILVTLWGARLTFNFAKKGAYSLKFWSGDEDYRWPYLRKQKPFTNKVVWAIFDLLFISVWQNIVVLGICLPLLAVMESPVSFGVWDGLVAAGVAGFLVVEVIADRQQNRFQNKKYEYLNSGKKLSELPMPYRRGFAITGLWSVMRHPNYLGEQGIWVTLYLFTITAGVCTYGVFHWTIFGSMLLLLIFAGSSRMAEGISVKKYEEYPAYQKRVFKYLPLRKYTSSNEE